MKGITELDFKTKAIRSKFPMIKPLKISLLNTNEDRCFSDKSSEKETASALKSNRASLISKIPTDLFTIEPRILNATEISGLRKNTQAKKTPT